MKNIITMLVIIILSSKPTEAEGIRHMKKNKVLPILECIEKIEKGRYISHFGYQNLTDEEQFIPIGVNNGFSPGAIDLGQPEHFLPGRHHDQFRVEFSSDKLIWSINSKDAIASRFSSRCSPIENSPFTFIDFPGSVGTIVQSISYSGEFIAGVYLDSQTGKVRGFLKRRGEDFIPIDWPNADQTFAQGVNSDGSVVGDYYDTNGIQHGFLRKIDGTFESISFPGAKITLPNSINDLGEIVGSYKITDPVDPSIFSRYFGFYSSPIRNIFTSYDFPELDPVVGETKILGINNAGFIIGDIVISVRPTVTRPWYANRNRPYDMILVPPITLTPPISGCTVEQVKLPPYTISSQSGNPILVGNAYCQGNDDITQAYIGRLSGEFQAIQFPAPISASQIFGFSKNFEAVGGVTTNDGTRRGFIMSLVDFP